MKKKICGLRISKMVSMGQKGSQNVQYCLKWSSMVPNGPTWSKQNDHKFKRMAFINRFNLVLVWSKIVQILTNKSSKWLWHNQVSWCSFYFSFLQYTSFYTSIYLCIVHKVEIWITFVLGPYAVYLVYTKRKYEGNISKQKGIYCLRPDGAY